MKTYEVEQTGKAPFTIVAHKFDTTTSEGISMATFYKVLPNKLGESWAEEEAVAFFYGVTSISIKQEAA